MCLHIQSVGSYSLKLELLQFLCEDNVRTLFSQVNIIHFYISHIHAHGACNYYISVNSLLRWRIMVNFMSVWSAYNPVEVQLCHLW